MQFSWRSDWPHLLLLAGARRVPVHDHHARVESFNDFTQVRA